MRFTKARNDQTPLRDAPITRGRSAARTFTAVSLLLVPCVAVLDVPLFNRLDPRVFGVPFIDAYLLAWVLLVVPFLVFASRLLNAPDES
jgi:hypothetical protein